LHGGSNCCDEQVGPSCPSSGSAVTQAGRPQAGEPTSQPFPGCELHPADIRVLQNIGHGSSGVVQKVLHTASDSILALKIIPVEAAEQKQKQILLELKTLHESTHPSIVSYYGAYFREGAVHVALEYMDASLLDVARSQAAALPEWVLASIARPLLLGLSYLHRERHIIHRDVKPANILIDSNGSVKLADFGVSGELGHTLAKCASWVGTIHYMSPERIQGGSYSYDSDVWSLGVTLLELATGKFPYSQERDGQNISFWDLLDAIVESPPPAPPVDFSPPFHSFVTACLHKEPEGRASSTALLAHPLLVAAAGAEASLTQWIRTAIVQLELPEGAGPGAGPADMKD
jgi:serine/threonine protein kinase